MQWRGGVAPSCDINLGTNVVTWLQVAILDCDDSRFQSPSSEIHVSLLYRSISLIVAIVNDGMVQIVWRLPWNLWNVCWLMAKCSDITDAIGPLALTSISGTTIMMHQFYVKSLWRIWRSRTRGWNTDTCMCTFFYLYSYWRWRLGCWIYFM